MRYKVPKGGHVSQPTCCRCQIPLSSCTCPDVDMPKRRQPPKPLPKELPLCDGPKLGLFQHHGSRIQWLERLNKDDEDEDSPTEGYVFRAKIRNREYAIKVVRSKRPLAIAR